MGMIGLYKLSANPRSSDLTYPDFVRRYSNEIERDQAIRDAMLIAQANNLRERQELVNYAEQAVSVPDDRSDRRWRIVEVTVLEDIHPQGY